MQHIYDYHLAISKKLGWDDMLVEIAVPAINAILRNFCATIYEIGNPFDFETAAYLISDWDSDAIFELLVDGDFSDEELCLFVDVREEIEYEMRNGVHYVDAINEWWK